MGHRDPRALGGFADQRPLPSRKSESSHGRKGNFGEPRETCTTRPAREAPTGAPGGFRQEPRAGGPARTQRLGRGGLRGGARRPELLHPHPLAQPGDTHPHRSSRATVQSRSARYLSGTPEGAETVGRGGRCPSPAQAALAANRHCGPPGSVAETPPYPAPPRSMRRGRAPAGLRLPLPAELIPRGTCSRLLKLSPA